MEGERSHSPQCSLQVDMYCTGLEVEMCLCENGDQHVIITFSRGERFEASLLFSLV